MESKSFDMSMNNPTTSFSLLISLLIKFNRNTVYITKGLVFKIIYNFNFISISVIGLKNKLLSEGGGR